MYLQMQGRAGERQRKDEPRFGLTHNLGGFPQRNVAASPSSANTECDHPRALPRRVHRADSPPLDGEGLGVG